MSTYRLSTQQIPQTEIEIRKLETSRPIAWLSLAWGDMRAKPFQSLGYGMGVALLGAVLAYLTMTMGRFYLVPFIFGGFTFIAPLLSIGLMAIAKQHEQPAAPERASLRQILNLNRPSIAMMGIFLVLIFINWIMLSNLLFGGVFHTVLPDYEQVRPLPAMFGESLPFLAIYGGLALVLAILVFRISALSLPMMVDQRVDAFNATFASWQAVGENWRAMALWALIIAGFCLVGFASYFAAFIILVPWLGYATWHAYRDTMVPQA